MKKSNLLLAIICIAFNSIIQAQNINERISKEDKAAVNTHKSLVVFYVKDARLNEVNHSEEYIKYGAKLIFYKIENDNKLYFSNYMTNTKSQSFGSIFSLKKEFFAETETEYAHEIISFYWNYYNTYDKKVGTAGVAMQLIYKPKGVYFKSTILAEDLDELVFKGEMEGDTSLLDKYIDKEDKD